MIERLFPTLTGMLAIMAVALAPIAAGASGDDASITVYKSPTCGCCAKWADYLAADGFDVRTVDRDDLDAVKSTHGVPPRLQSCHTAVVDGYVIEGHVPAQDIRRLLRDRPNLIGLSAPGMPPLSPGMASTEPRDYDVLGFDAEGKVSVYSRY